MLLHDIKINDHDAKIGLILRSRRHDKKLSSQKNVMPTQSMIIEDEHEMPDVPLAAGIELGELISILDQMKDDLRKELIGRIEFEGVEKRV